MRRIGNADASAVNAQRAIGVVATMRRHEARYALRLDGMIDGEHMGSYDRLTKLIATLETDMATRGTLTQLAADYYKLFEAWKAKANDIQSRIEAVDRSFTTVAPVIDEARKLIKKSRDNAEIEASAQLARANLLAVSMMAISLAAALALAFMIARSLARPLDVLRGAMNRIADGETELSVAGQARKDEIGQMARALDRLRVGVAERATMSEQQLIEARSAAERSQRVEAAAGGFRNAMADAARRLSDAISALNSASDQMRTGASDLSARARASAKQPTAHAPKRPQSRPLPSRCRVQAAKSPSRSAVPPRSPIAPPSRPTKPAARWKA